MALLAQAAPSHQSATKKNLEKYFKAQETLRHQPEQKTLFSRSEGHFEMHFLNNLLLLATKSCLTA